MRKLLYSLLVVSLFLPSLVLAVDYATVFNPISGARKVVEVGDPNAFAGGFELETPTNYYRIGEEIVVQCLPGQCEEGKDLGYSVVSRYRTRLSSSMTSTQTTVPVSSLETFDGHTLAMSDLGNKVFLTLEPGTSREEIIKCTAITSGDWSSCTRGLAFYGTTETEVAANRSAHNAGSIVVMSNVHYVYEQVTDLDTAQSPTGLWTFYQYPLVNLGGLGYASSSNQLVTFDQLNAIASQGVATSTESIFGGVYLGTQLEMASSTFDANMPTVLYSLYSTSSPQVRGLYIPISENDGYLNQGWLDLLNESWTFNNLTSATSTFTTSTVTDLTINTDATLAGESLNTLINDSNADALHYHEGVLGRDPAGYYTYSLDTSGSSWGATDATFAGRAGFFNVESSAATWQAQTLLPALDGATEQYQWNDNKIIEFEFTARIVNTGGGDKTMGFGENQAFLVAYNSTAVDRVGFTVDGTTLYTVTANSAAVTTASVAGVTVTNSNHYKIVLNGTTSASFYVNGTLATTTVMTLPVSADNVYLGFGGDTNTDQIVTVVGPMIRQQL